MSDILPTLIVALVIVAIACGAIFVMIRDRRMGKNSCGCNCSGCSSKCDSRSTDKKEDEE